MGAETSETTLELTVLTVKGSGEIFLFLLFLINTFPQSTHDIVTWILGTALKLQLCGHPFLHTPAIFASFALLTSFTLSLSLSVCIIEHSQNLRLL